MIKENPQSLNFGGFYCLFTIRRSLLACRAAARWCHSYSCEKALHDLIQIFRFMYILLMHYCGHHDIPEGMPVALNFPLSPLLIFFNSYTFTVMKKFLKDHYILLLAVLVVIVGYLYIMLVGSSYDLVIQDQTDRTEVPVIQISSDSKGNAEITGWEYTNKGLTIHLKSVSAGKIYLETRTESNFFINILYIHSNGVITNDHLFGDCRGSTEVIILSIVFLLYISFYLVIRYRKLVRTSLYSYDNVLYLGLIVYSFYLITTQLQTVFDHSGINGSFSHISTASEDFVMYTLPLVLLTTIIVTASNIKLIIKEGASWRNLLGLFLGLTLGLGSILPFFLSNFFYYHQHVIQVQNEKGLARYIVSFFEEGIASIVTYFECILLGTIITSLKAARHIPEFNKDYIVINGCQIRKDGTLTKLLQSRVDRAIEFSKMQFAKTGKPVIFVPSGGKGNDEVISEGEAIKRYLLQSGISEERIIAETVSRTTEENFRLSSELIKQHCGNDDYKLAFSTTNYHVFRSGLLAEQQGIKAEGIGSKTKAYFWLNAFIREFIASIINRKKQHLKVIAALILIVLLSNAMRYIAGILR